MIGKYLYASACQHKIHETLMENILWLKYCLHENTQTDLHADKGS